jgi:RHS repeat-associated protein
MNPRGYLNAPTDSTGLTHLGAREYDPATGRFMSVDPVMDTANPQQFNAFVYSNNNPVTFSDPSGLYCDSCDFYDKTHTTSAAGNSVGCSYSLAHKCASPKPHQVEVNNGTGNPAKQPIIYGHRLPTAKEMQQGPIFGAPIMMAPGETYGQAVLNWAIYVCNSGMDAESGFCQWSYSIGNEKADDWDALWTVVEAVALAATPEFNGLKGSARAADEVIDVAGLACSFTGDTQVLMADGSHKPIKDVKVGDQVLAVDPDTGERAPREVTALIVHQDTVLDLVLQDGSRVTTTEDHPFWNVTDGAWERADQLDPGDALLTADGRTARVVGLDPTSARTATAHNLTVAVSHTYYVGDVPVAVHNMCPPVGGIPKKVVNSNMGHIDLERAQRAGFSDKQSAQQAVRDLSATIQRDGFPEGSIPDTARTDRILVPIGSTGYAVYQCMPNGNAVFKTILQRR